MKLPRWLVIGMLTSSVLAVLAAAGWWWVTWPERTLEQFKWCVATGRFAAANSMIVMPEDPIGKTTLNGKYMQEHPEINVYPIQRPSIRDLYSGRRIWQNSGIGIKVTFERGKLRAFKFSDDTPYGLRITEN